MGKKTTVAEQAAKIAELYRSVSEEEVEGERQAVAQMQMAQRLLRDAYRVADGREPASVQMQLRLTAEPTPEPFVTLDQAAAIVQKSKHTLRKKPGLPTPDVEGHRGQPHLWAWSRIRPWLEEEYRRNLPATFPTKKNA